MTTQSMEIAFELLLASAPAQDLYLGKTHRLLRWGLGNGVSLFAVESEGERSLFVSTNSAQEELLNWDWETLGYTSERDFLLAWYFRSNKR